MFKPIKCMDDTYIVSNGNIQVAWNVTLERAIEICEDWNN